MNQYKYKVSIVIVCMNNLKYLYPCLDSIRKYTTVSYETFVVAYIFSPENLSKLRNDYPWITIIESNEIRGFSENNNLALRKASGEYCFVVNDDTLMKQPVIDELVATISTLPKDVSILSPVTLNGDGSVQRCGKPKYTLWTYILGNLRLMKFVYKHSKYVNQQGVFKTYNISGACFLIKTSDFKNLGWFDERYFFCPEDIALSTAVNNSGKFCYVDSNVKITHYGGGTWSKMIKATKPASVKGSYIFYGENNILKKGLFILISTIFYLLYSARWLSFLFNKREKDKTMFEANINALCALYSSKTPKNIFIKYYNKLKSHS